MNLILLLSILLGIPLVLLLWLALAYNRLVAYQVQANEAWSGIEVQLKRRHDLIPNLEATVKGYARHERDIFTRLAADRAQALQARGQADVAAAENRLTKALSSLLALAEAYPDLKANQNFLQLQTALQEVEEQLQLARRYYNAVVRLFNTQCRSFPSLVVARLFGFHSRDFFEITEAGERETPRISAP